MLTGQVSEFDSAKGLGTVVDDDGVEYLFHCVEIADGTREIEVGRRVSFQPRPKFGRLQAAELRKR